VWGGRVGLVEETVTRQESQAFEFTHEGSGQVVRAQGSMQDGPDSGCVELGWHVVYDVWVPGSGIMVENVLRNE